MRQSLELLYRLQGRTGEVRDLILESWSQADDRADVLRRLYLVDNSAFPADYVRKTLEGADPNDDRVWLGKANLASWTGQFDEASRWLAECARRRPDDQAVWRAQLELARSSGDLETVRRAVQQLSLGRFTQPEVLSLRAWLAARTGNTQVESDILRSLTIQEPGNISAWDRLAELALQAGRKSDADLLRKKKLEFNRTREEYKTLIGRDDRAVHCGELARLAGELGRLIEARGWALIERGRAAQEPLVSDDLRDKLSAGPGRALGSALDDLVSTVPSGPGPRSPRPVSGDPSIRRRRRAGGTSIRPRQRSNPWP